MNLAIVIGWVCIFLTLLSALIGDEVAVVYTMLVIANIWFVGGQVIREIKDEIND